MICSSSKEALIRDLSRDAEEVALCASFCDHCEVKSCSKVDKQRQAPEQDTQVSAFNPTVRVHNHGRVILLQDDAAHKIDRFTYVASKNTRSC